jgi:FkbH-like protein
MSTLLQQRLAWGRISKNADRVVDLRVGVLASFTANPIGPYLGMELASCGFEGAVEIGPFDQITQGLMQPEMVLGEVDVLVVWSRLDDIWNRERAPLVEGDGAHASEILQSIVAQAGAVSAELGISVVVVLPDIPQIRPLGVGDAGNVYGVAATSTSLREAMRSAASSLPGVLLVDADEVVRELGANQSYDHRRLASASIPYTEDFFSSIANRIARILRLDRRGSKKVAVVDADNTLWGGVIGEDGPDGIDLSESGPGNSYRSFQRYLTDLRRAGLLIAVASKNNETDFWEGFARREMVLQRSDLAAWRVGWEPKSLGIEEMADELNLGIASMVFIDDSHVEIGEVSGRQPEVACLQMPTDPAEWYAAIGANGALDRLPPTSSDLGRAASYAQETQRRVARSTASMDEFLGSLGLSMSVIDPTSADLPRLSQLVAKTNQFTLGGHRHSEAEIAALLSSQNIRARMFSLVDNFGDYGVIGALIVDRQSERSVLDTFVLSCRAMGRGVEDAMLAVAAELAVGPVSCQLIETPKNRPIRNWLASKNVTLEVPHLSTEAVWPSHINRL